MSHPIWVRGLKPRCLNFTIMLPKSHPIWVRGLKLIRMSGIESSERRTPYGCVD